MEISVCSWSYCLSAERVADEMTKCDVKNVHLALIRAALEGNRTSELEE